LDYREFIDRKRQINLNSGFDPLWIPEWLHDFQKFLCDWSIRHGRGAIFADCGAGKTPMQLVWAENVVMQTNKPVLLLTPLAVGQQTLREATKFDIDAERSSDGSHTRAVVITNYERLHHFNPEDFSGVVCDES